MNKQIANVTDVTEVEQNKDTNKGDASIMKTVENRNYLKENGYLYTVQDILSALSKSEGFKSRGSKNFSRVLGAMSKGVKLLDILRDPKAVGVPTNQTRYFENFIEEHKLAKRVYTPTRKGVLVPIAHVANMEIRNNKVYSTIDYSEVNVDSYKEISESFLSDTLASDAETIEFTRNGELIKQRVMLPMRGVFFVNQYLDLPETEEEYDSEQRELVKVRTLSMKEGFYFIDQDGEEGHAAFLLRTPSQARVLQAIFIDTNFMDPVEALKLMGNELIAYGKKNEKGNWVVSVDKMITRPGLAGTNTVLSKTIDIGNKIVLDKKGNQWITGGTHEMVVVEDRMVNITTGTYRAWDKNKQMFREFDASEHPLTLTAADGALFADEEVYHTLGAEFGQFNDAWQVRITPFVKGLMVFVPGLRAYYDAHIVALKSAVKGDFKNLFEANPMFKPQLRIAMFNKNMKQAKTYTDMPYQFIQASSLNTADLWNVMKPHLQEVENALYDPTIMKKYVGLDKVIEKELFSDEVEHYMLDQSRVSTFTTFLDQFDWSFEDVQMKRYALDVLKEKIEDWRTGNIPVEGHYRYIMQDPYAVLEAGTKYEERNEKGQLLVLNRGDYHIQPQEAYVPSAIETKSNLYVAAGRNPMIAKGEWQVLRHRPLAQYERGTRKGAFRNMIIMGVHDFAVFSMGGADVDGDTALVATEPIVVNSLKNKYVSPVMDISFIEKENKEVEFLGDGVPYSMEMSGVYKLPEGVAEEQSDYTITFTSEQNTDALYQEAHKLGIDYVIRTLKPNKIGLATNIASILADGVRGHGYRVALNNSKSSLDKIKKYENWIDILRLVQGWEIDAAKHGGAYQEVMAHTLGFMENPPEELSYFNKGLGKRVWSKPNWLAARQDKKGHDFGSVLSRLLKLVDQFEERHLDNAFERMYAQANQHSILSKLNASFNLEPNYFNNLAIAVKQIKTTYGYAVRNLYKAAELRKQEVVNHNYPEDIRHDKFEEIDLHVRNTLNEVADHARDQIADLCTRVPAKDVGYMSYYVTYVDRKADASLSFPWSIAREAFIHTLNYVENKEKQDQIMPNTVIDNNFNMAVCIPDNIQEAYTMETVMKGLTSESVSIWAQGDKYKLFINKTEVGFVYNSRNNIDPLLGHDKFVARVNTISIGGGTRTLNLEVGQLIKAVV